MSDQTLDLTLNIRAYHARGVSRKIPNEVADRLRRVEGRHNPLVKELRAAFGQGDLTSDGYCAIEGTRIIEEAVRSGLKFRAVFFRASAENKAERLMPQMAAYVEALVLPDKLFASAVQTESPQGVAALVKVKLHGLEELLAHRREGPLVVVAGVQDPGNMGTILRSAEAFGASGVVLAEGSAHPFNSKVVRASAGSVFRLPIAQTKEVPLSELRDAKLQLIATSSHKGIPLPEAKFASPLALFVGNEGAGLSRDLIADMDETVVIPHAPHVESLNVGVAASIVLYEIAKQQKRTRT